MNINTVIIVLFLSFCATRVIFYECKIVLNNIIIRFRAIVEIKCYLYTRVVISTEVLTSPAFYILLFTCNTHITHNIIKVSFGLANSVAYTATIYHIYIHIYIYIYIYVFIYLYYSFALSDVYPLKLTVCCRIYGHGPLQSFYETPPRPFDKKHSRSFVCK